MKLNLQGKSVLITGGTKGIGKEIARAFLREEAKVIVCARSIPSNWEEDIFVITGDVTDSEDRKRIFTEATAEVGPIDVLINNAGGSNGGLIDETEMEDFYHAFELNYFSAVHFSKLVLPAMKAEKAGAIINISSIFGRESGGKATYNNAKAAMISLQKHLQMK